MTRKEAPRIILASQSPRRAHLLRMLGLDFDIRPAEVDETYVDGEPAPVHAERLAREKAQAVAREAADSLVIGSDTVVVLGKDVLGKPRDRDHAIDMLMKLEGRAHRVETGIAVARDGNVLSGVESVKVHFRTFDRRTAEAYVKTGEPMDKAGAYGIQGYGSALVERIDGDYYAVMGLPVAHMLSLIEAHGFRYTFRGLEPKHVS
jgi:septum formation protein